MPGSWKAWEFPNLKETDYQKTSEASDNYNCLAWVVGDSSKKWDPDEMEQNYWPEDLPRVQDIGVFKELYRKSGFEDCKDASFEHGFEKIAIYATSNGKPTHAALQLANGQWTSKLGEYEDIEHKTLECLNGERNFFGTIQCYGKPLVYMKRVRRA